MYLQLKHFIAIGLSLVGAGLAILGSTQTWDVCKWIGFALMIIAVMIRMAIRCPNCGRCLVHRRLTLPKFCPECGQAIDGNAIEE